MFGEGIIGVRQEAIAVHRVAVDRAGRWQDQKDESIAPYDPHHLLEGAPKELDMLQRLTGDDDVDRALGKRDPIGIAEYDVDAWPGCDIRGAIAKRRVWEQLAIAAIDIGTAHIQNDCPRPLLKQATGDVPPIASPHVFER
jgi:hypothetical protein